MNKDRRRQLIKSAVKINVTANGDLITIEYKELINQMELYATQMAVEELSNVACSTSHETQEYLDERLLELEKKLKT